MSQRLAGKVVVITGAASGMGAASAKLLASEGATIIGGDVNAERLETVAHEVQAAGGKMVTLVGDISTKEGANALIAKATEGEGRLDVLVNNAGIMDNFEGVAKVEDQVWHRVMSVNLYAPMALSRAAVQWMKEHGGGAIVNVASAAGVGGGAAGAAYTASKHGVVGLTKNTAIAYAPAGIRCNAIIVGGVATNIMESINQEKIDQEAMAQFGKWHGVTPGQLQPEDIANVVLFLSLDESKMINGATVEADAGWMAH